MANELAVDKIRIRMNVPIVIATKVEKLFSTAVDKGSSDAYIRALEEAVRDVRLTKKEYAKIADRVEQNRTARLAARERAKSSRGSAEKASLA